MIEVVKEITISIYQIKKRFNKTDKDYIFGNY